MHFLVIARGSARETCGRYTRMKHRLSADLIAGRTTLREEMIYFLTVTLRKLRPQPETK